MTSRKKGELMTNTLAAGSHRIADSARLFASIHRAIAAGAMLLVCAIAPAELDAQARTDSQLEADIQELKKGQEEIKKELAEIKKLVTPPPPPPVAEKLDAAVAVGSIVMRGNKSAPVTMIEFSDYQCPFCKRHLQQTVPTLVKDYVDTGKVRYVFRDFPLAQIHPLATKAAEAARCAGEQGKYWEMHDRLFENQNALEPEKLPGHAKAIGLDETKFRQCFDAGRYASAVQQDLEAGTKIGIRGTPAIVLGTTDGDQVKNAVLIRGAHPVATFKAEIDKLLAAPATKD
jgi:protein-disulfide isomerase